MNIGNINLALENYEVAIQYYLQSLEIKEEHSYAGIDIAYYKTISQIGKVFLAHLRCDSLLSAHPFR